MIMEFKFNEEQKIRTAVELNQLRDMPVRKAIWVLVLYYIKLCSHKKVDVFDDVVNYIDSNFPGVYYEEYISDIERCLRRANKYELKNIGKIQITQSEIETCRRFDDMRKQKITFVLIALAKYFNALYKINKDCLWAKQSEIFKMARVSIATKERGRFFGFAYQEGILVPHYSVGQNLLIVDVVSHDEDDPVVMELDEGDYLDLAYSYLNYVNGGGYKRCATCGRWFKMIKKEPNRRYCHIHKPKKEPVSPFRNVKCCDCGDWFLVPKSNKRAIRCEKCNERRKTENAEKVQK